ncbi:HAAS signaling domain-containing protein [Fictibacillus phosphorivorans]|uniref:HAAS signaling domain-containing protein n=1 Tax=Fictibacillus phosphorivorans TaxID=1221500 RepID=UPI00204197B8|nr:hypothetical protein [Fictibacillus phosphorivorans]MCM3719292.1 hypothetical protein [Fictibacillus phosphorivorans]MCM3776914.1 hypothetical protein [Fictibacillus phosphorivorans]
MNLQECYINEVTRRLPVKIRDDIAMELRSIIEDMLPDEHTEEDLKKVLSKLGDPAKLANEYQDKPRYIIGPDFYDSYINVLIVAAIISVVVSSLALFVHGIMTFDEDKSLFALLSLVGQLSLKMLLSSFNVLFQVFFWVTIVFIVLERTGLSYEKGQNKKKPWTPDDLYQVEKVEKKRQIPKSEVFFSLFWTALWATILFNASNLIGWYEQTGEGLKGLKLEAPLFNQDVLYSYAPFLILLIAIEIGLAIYKFFIGKWTKALAVINMVYHFFSLGLLCVMLTDSTLFNKAFTLKLFEAFKDVPAGWWIGTIISTMVIFSIIDIISGFNKAAAKTNITNLQIK